VFSFTRADEGMAGVGARYERRKGWRPVAFHSTGLGLKVVQGRPKASLTQSPGGPGEAAPAQASQLACADDDRQSFSVVWEVEVRGAGRWAEPQTGLGGKSRGKGPGSPAEAVRRGLLKPCSWVGVKTMGRMQLRRGIRYRVVVSSTVRLAFTVRQGDRSGLLRTGRAGRWGLVCRIRTTDSCCSGIQKGGGTKYKLRPRGGGGLRAIDQLGELCG
jgi:hypothetical protein